MSAFFGLATPVEDALNTLFTGINSLLPQIIILIIAGIIIFAIYKILSYLIFHGLKQVVKFREDLDSIHKIWRYSFLFLVAIILIFSFSGNLAAAGLSIGLLSAALGWALQKPITGIAAWLMITITKPFKIGDRVLIDNSLGDIKDIKMFYLVLEEVGGIISGEENSGRTIMIPTSLLFEKPITNYTFTNPYVLNDVEAEFTYESNLKKIEKIMKEAATSHTKEYSGKVKTKPFTRIAITANGMKATVRYLVKAKDSAEVKTNIAREIYEKVMDSKDMEFAYPHTEIVMPKNTQKNRQKQSELNHFQ